jgi:hypothetical protein
MCHLVRDGSKSSRQGYYKSNLDKEKVKVIVLNLEVDMAPRRDALLSDKVIECDNESFDQNSH